MTPALPRSLPDRIGTSEESPLPRLITAQVVGGLDGALRFVTMLRGRRYRIRDLSFDVREGDGEGQIRCTAVLTASDAQLLLERLRRMPIVVSVDSR